MARRMEEDMRNPRRRRIVFEAFYSIRMPVEEHAPERQPEDAQVEERVPVRDVVKVELDALPKGRVAAPAVDLGPAGDAALDAVPGHVVGNRLRQLVDELRLLRSRADEAHIADQNVDKLRQFVEAGLPQELAERSATVVVLRGHARAGLVGIDVHAAELEHVERLAV